MYLEPHLQKKSDECAKIWREWFEMFSDKEKRNLPECKELREKWFKCCNEFEKIISQELKTNPRYKNFTSIDNRVE